MLNFVVFLLLFRSSPTGLSTTWASSDSVQSASPAAAQAVIFSTPDLGAWLRDAGVDVNNILAVAAQMRAGCDDAFKAKACPENVGKLISAIAEALSKVSPVPSSVPTPSPVAWAASLQWSGHITDELKESLDSKVPFS